jgi:hypothetical protein
VATRGVVKLVGSRTSTRAAVAAVAAICAWIAVVPVGGAPFRSQTGLRLLVADVPAPFLLDVDRGSVQTIKGLPANGERGVSVLPLGKHALVLSFRFCDRCRGGVDVYWVRHGSTSAIRLGRALEAVPARNGRAVWMLRRQGLRHCTVRKVDLSRRPRGVARAVSCRAGLVAELPAGLLINSTGPLGKDAHSALLKPHGGVVRFPDEEAQPVVGNLVLSGADRSRPLLLHDMRTGSVRRISWPGRRSYSLGDVTGARSGRFAIVEFAKFSPEHRLDMWLLDTQRRRWLHLPGMPAHLVPKITDVKWTVDRRVVVLSGGTLLLWEPGAARLAPLKVRAPKRSSSGFVIF